jgi:TRAP-type transport system periplasmic protein
MSSLRSRVTRRETVGLLTVGFANVFLGFSASKSAWAAPSSPGKVTTIRYAHGAPTTHPSHIWGTKFGEALESMTGGSLKVQIFPNVQLGKDPEVVGEVQAGVVEMINSGNSVFSQYVPSATIMDMPYLFKDLDHLYRVQDGPIGQQISKLYEEKAFRVLGWADIGIRHITNSKRPIEKPGDLKGLKIRVVPSKVFVEIFKALGPNVVTLDFSELYLALQQGVVDGEDNPTTTIQSAKFYEVQKYLSLTGHVVGTNPSVISDKFFAKQSPDVQKALIGAGAEATKATRQFVRDNETKALDFLKGKGMVVNAPNRLPFRAATASVYQRLKEQAPPDLVAKIRALA